MGTDTHTSRGNAPCLGQALARMLEERYPLQTQKCVSQALGCTPKAAENLLRGHLSRRNLTLVIAAFGPGFVADAVMLAAGTTLENFIRSQAADAKAEATRHQERATGLAQLERTLLASRRSQPAGRLGRDP